MWRLCLPSSLPATFQRASINLRSLSSTDKQWQAAYLKAPQAGAPIPRDLTARQRRIIYRSKQRGWLELDILFGNWAAKHVPGISDERHVEMVERLLEAETPDVLKWVLGQSEPPLHFRNEILASLRDYATGDGHVNDR